MLRRASNRSSTSSRLSREDDDDKGSVRRLNSQRSGRRTTVEGSQSGSRSSRNSRSMIYDEEKASFYENCKSVYLMVLDNVKDDVTSREELMLCKTNST